MRCIPIVFLAAVACASPDRRSGTVIFASGADLQSMNSLITTHPLARQVQRHVLLTTLVRYDSSMQVVPYLARRWQWSPDSLSLRMTVVRGLRWHDGVATTSADVQWTLDAARDPATGYPRHTELAGLVAVEAPDDTSVVLRFGASQRRIPDVLTDLAILPRHHLAGTPRPDLRRAGWNDAPVGNGPFHFVRHEPNRRWVFEAQPDFPAELGGPPLIERLVIAVVDEPTTKLAALASGELDFAGINPAHAAFVARDPRLAVVEYPLLFTYVLTFNTRRSPFNRIQSRRAVAAAINRKAVVDGYLFGFGTPATSAVPPGLGEAATQPAVPVVAPDASVGTPIAFEMLTVGSGDAPLEQMLQTQLRTAGIRATIRQLELTSFLDRVHGQRHDFDAAVMGVTGDPALGHLSPLVTLAGLAPPLDTDAAREVLADSMPVTFLYHARGVQGMNRRMRGVRMDLRGELVSITSWYVE